MFVVTLPVSAQKNPLAFALKAKKAGADVLEIRADLITSLPSFTSPLPILLALRGGNPDWIDILRPQYLDLELHEDLPPLPKGIEIIRSYHNYDRTPSLAELHDIAQSLAQAGASIIKIAVTLQTYDDLVRLDQFQKALGSEYRRIVLGMGEKAQLSRLLSPLSNELTYSYLDGDKPAVVGQVPLSLHRLTTQCATPRLFGLLGGKQSIKSISPLIHNTLFHGLQFDALYALFPAEELEESFEAFRALGIAGLSVTSPFKRAVVGKCHRLDDVSQRLQSVNTMIREGDDWAGYNTDVLGITQGYPFLAGCKRIAIIGSGGVVPSIIAACEDVHGGARIQVYARNRMARDELSELYDVTCHDLERIHEAEFDCVICSVTEDIAVPLPDTHGHPYAIDLRYGKQTKFLQSAESKGYEIHNGLPMLIHQALRQCEIFTGRLVSSDIIDLLTKILHPSSSSFIPHS